MLLASLAQMPAYIELMGRLWGRPLSERGPIASDDSRNFLGQDGRVLWRRRLSQPNGPPRFSASAESWRWAYNVGRQIPANARVYINVPRDAVYFYASFFWYPAEVVVNSGGAPIKDAASLAEHGVFLPSDQLSRLADKFTHAVVDKPGEGVRLIELRRPMGAP
jgi:hypothetical protein